MNAPDCMLMTGDPKIKEEKAKGKVKNDKQCAKSCAEEYDCVLWRFSKKEKTCFISMLTYKKGNDKNLIFQDF